MNYLQQKKEEDEARERRIDSILEPYLEDEKEQDGNPVLTGVNTVKWKEERKKLLGVRKKKWEKANSKLVKDEWKFMQWNKKAEKKSKIKESERQTILRQK